MAERFKFNDEEENIDENDNQQDDLEKEYYDNTDYSYTKSKNKKRRVQRPFPTIRRGEGAGVRWTPLRSRSTDRADR